MKRHSLYLDEELVKIVKEIADSQKRSLSYMVSVLLHNAIREKLRKKSKKQKDGT